MQTSVVPSAVSSGLAWTPSGKAVDLPPRAAGQIVDNRDEVAVTILQIDGGTAIMGELTAGRVMRRRRERRDGARCRIDEDNLLEAAAVVRKENHFAIGRPVWCGSVNAEGAEHALRAARQIEDAEGRAHLRTGGDAAREDGAAAIRRDFNGKFGVFAARQLLRPAAIDADAVDMIRAVAVRAEDNGAAIGREGGRAVHRLGVVCDPMGAAARRRNEQQIGILIAVVILPEED